MKEAVRLQVFRQHEITYAILNQSGFTEQNPIKRY